MAVTIKFRRGSASEWVTANTVLKDGEPGYEKSTGKMKIGNGATPWSDLPYFAGSAGASVVTTTFPDPTADPAYDSWPEGTIIFLEA